MSEGADARTWVIAPIAWLGAAILLALALCIVVLGAPAADVRALAVMLALSGAGSLLGAGALLRAGHALGFRRLGQRLVFANLAVILVALVNVGVASGLMFISGHDFGLLAVLLVFSGVVSLAFAASLSQHIVAVVSELVAGARKIAAGDLTARVPAGDNDELDQLGRAFNMMAAKLEESDAMRHEVEDARRQLVAAISHDLRTPLASIRAMVEAIQDGVVSDQETIDRYVRSIHGEVRHLSQLIDDLFELSRLDAGVLALQFETGSLHDLLSDTLEALQPQATRHGLRISGHVDDRLPPVMMDTSRIQRVLYNLVQNAIRHTPPDGTIVLEARDEGADIRVDVIDSGEGVAPADLPHVFERFYRGEKSRARGQGGAGLGLAIAKGLVEAHGGRIWVQNLPERGACFSFALPKATPGIRDA